MLSPLQVALLAVLGAAAGHVYLQLLIRDVDGLDPADGRVAPFLASADSQLSLWTIGCGLNPALTRRPTCILSATPAHVGRGRAGALPFSPCCQGGLQPDRKSG